MMNSAKLDEDSLVLDTRTISVARRPQLGCDELLNGDSESALSGVWEAAKRGAAYWAAWSPASLGKLDMGGLIKQPEKAHNS